MKKLKGTGAARVAWVIAAVCILGGAGVAQAGFITTTVPPDLFPPGSFITGGPSVCIAAGPLTGVCTSNERTTIDSSTVIFPGDGNEDVVLDGVVTGDTTSPTGTFALAGTEDLTIIGRSNPFATGTFAIDVTSEDFTGNFFGRTIGLSLDPAGVHEGQTTVTALNGQRGYLIDTSLVISHAISVDGAPPTPIGTAHATVGVPEPAGLALLALPLFVVMRLRRDRPARKRTEPVAAQ